MRRRDAGVGAVPNASRTDELAAALAIRAVPNVALIQPLTIRAGKRETVSSHIGTPACAAKGPGGTSPPLTVAVAFWRESDKAGVQLFGWL